jgi:23S rRNA (guanosine2251-2'-O)-methyltransferase
LEYLKGSCLQVFAATEKSGQTIYSVDLTVPAAVLMGAEDTGISAPLLQYVDHSVSIPQYGTIGSLNVSVAAGIIIYEAVRQRMG